MSLVTPHTEAAKAEMIRVLTLTIEAVKTGQVSGLGLIAAAGPGGVQVTTVGQPQNLIIGAEKMKLDLLAHLFKPQVMQ